MLYNSLKKRKVQQVSAHNTNGKASIDINSKTLTTKGKEPADHDRLPDYRHVKNDLPKFTFYGVFPVSNGRVLK